MPFHPLEAVGLIEPRNSDTSQRQPLGTCFRFRHERVALTAAHCVPESGDLTLRFPRSRRTQIVEDVRRHATADVAVLITDNQPTDPGTGYAPAAFWDRVSNWALGEEFMTYGYPAEPASFEDDPAPPRLLVGYYQRFFRITTPAGYRYQAVELSIPAPAGMSGSPLFRRGAPQMVTGLVTTSVESYTVADYIEERTVDGHVSRLEARKVLSYGLALLLSGVTDWRHEVIPPRDIAWIP